MSNNKQQTAVEKLESFFRRHCNPSVCDIEWNDFNTAFLEGKAMHFEENADTWNNAIDAVEKDKWDSFEQYYNEKFGGNNEQQ
jgi:hypothetical protein